VYERSLPIIRLLSEAGGNVLRVMRRAEAVAASMKDVLPALDKLPPAP
jgi:hypothetical protein